MPVCTDLLGFLYDLADHVDFSYHYDLNGMLDIIGIRGLKVKYISLIDDILELQYKNFDDNQYNLDFDKIQGLQQMRIDGKQLKIVAYFCDDDN